ncbi:response regulator transcription factor [Planosporangium thailandense]|uniref:Response regulator transcription factor n=1 Tax=Planosporangium thailandense TaxID=765197 RepID=A0ABX0Y1B6_9ACTN|nr:response regulator transcription factor [Planosporangium thailandense]NJC71149.1 response regulator transcription factor [Planosporangium thailandense]
MPDTPLRVVLADDHYLVREGTRQLLELDGQVLVVASVEDAEQLMTAVDEHHPDVVITDIRMPPTHTLEGVAAAHRLREKRSDLGIVVLSNHADPDYALELFKDGMTGFAYLLKDRVGDRSQLLAAVRAVAAGDSVIDPVVVEGLVHRRARQETSPLSRLTDRERDVLEGMAAGRTNAAIAAHLHLSVSAVEKNVNSIFSKLGLTDEPTMHRRVGAVLTYLAHPPA